MVNLADLTTLRIDSEVDGDGDLVLTLSFDGYPLDRTYVEPREILEMLAKAEREDSDSE